MDASGNACDIVPGTPTNPPTVTLELTTNCASGAASGDADNKGVFTWGGGLVATGAGTCQGFSPKVPLIPCNQLTPPQYTQHRAVPRKPGSAHAQRARSRDTPSAADGSGIVATQPNLRRRDRERQHAAVAVDQRRRRDLRRQRYEHRPLARRAGGPAPALDAIKLHLNPKEKTIFILVTDGDQNCTPFTLGMAIQAPWSGVTSGDDEAALGAAAAAQKLYSPDTLANKGNGAGARHRQRGRHDQRRPRGVGDDVPRRLRRRRGRSPARTGSPGAAPACGGPSEPSAAQDTWTTIPTQAERDACKTCIDSFLAPDPDTLKRGAHQGDQPGRARRASSRPSSRSPTRSTSSPATPRRERRRRPGARSTRATATTPWCRTASCRPSRCRSSRGRSGPTRRAARTRSRSSMRRACVRRQPAGRTGPEDVPGTACRRWSANDKLVARWRPAWRPPARRTLRR